MQTMRYGARHDIPVGRLCGYGGGAPIAAVPAWLSETRRSGAWEQTGPHAGRRRSGAAAQIGGVDHASE
jgi:hypothetical protein